MEGNIFKLVYPITKSQNGLTREYGQAILVKGETRLYLPQGDKLELTGNLYALKIYDLFLPLTSAVEFNENVNIVGLGMTATMIWSLFQHENWGINVNGTVSSGVDSRQQRNRWNFEHRIGCGANYKFNGVFQISVGAYHYKIMEGSQFENPTNAYINSGGGFLTLSMLY